MKTTVLSILIFISFHCQSQNSNRQSFESLKSNLIETLYRNKSIDSVWFKNLKSGSYSFNLKGLQNDTQKGELSTGVYAFTVKNYTYFVLVEENGYMLLDFSTRHGLDLSLLNLIDFCERNMYCVEITNDYVTRLLRIYHNANKNLARGFDVNCEKGIRDIKSLP